MARINPPSDDQQPVASVPLLDAVATQLGVVPNLMKLVSHSPAALEGYLALNGALARGVLGSGLRECIAIAVAEENGCNYCLSAHAWLAANVARVDAAEIDAARDATSADTRVGAALHFARRVVRARGHVTDADLLVLHAAGFDDAAVIEIVLNVALNVLTNYVNNVAQTDIDFPEVTCRNGGRN